MKALNVFISRIVQHPILSGNEHFKLFITAKQPVSKCLKKTINMLYMLKLQDFNLHRRQRTNCVKHANNINSINPKNRHIEFDKVKSYLNILAEKLVSIEKISNRINKERHELVTEMNYFYPIFGIWASNEPQLANILQCIGNSIERDAVSQTAVISSYANVLGNPIKEFLTYIEVVQETVNKRDVYQSIYDISLEELNKKRDEKEKVRKPLFH